MDITDDAGRGHSVLISPGQHHKGVVVGFQVHIGFVDAHEAVNGGTVKHHLAVERLLNLAAGNGDILHKAEDVDKLQAEEVDVLLFYDFHNLFSGHRMYSFSGSVSVQILLSKDRTVYGYIKKHILKL